jgi:hypothetical protein
MKAPVAIRVGRWEVSILGIVFTCFRLEGVGGASDASGDRSIRGRISFSPTVIAVERRRRGEWVPTVNRRRGSRDHGGELIPLRGACGAEAARRR